MKGISGGFEVFQVIGCWGLFTAVSGGGLFREIACEIMVDSDDRLERSTCDVTKGM